MKNEIIIAGFGGQGTLAAGMLIAKSAIEQGLNTTWFPSYGAEMRGGTANSTAIISDDEIGSPVSFHPDALIALSAQALDKFIPRLAKGAIIISSYKQNIGSDFSFYFIDAVKIAESEINNPKSTNMIMVGALTAALEKRAASGTFLKFENVIAACQNAYLAKPQFAEPNKKALSLGYKLIMNGEKN